MLSVNAAETLDTQIALVVFVTASAVREALGSAAGPDDALSRIA